VLVLAALLIYFIFVAPVASAESSGSEAQYAVYNISGRVSNHSVSITVNETLKSNFGSFQKLALELISSNVNMSYSELVNASQDLLPIIPSIGSTSIHTTVNGTTISASVTQTDSSVVIFNGTNYTLANYLFNFSAQNARISESAHGQFMKFPSGLVYSASISINGTGTITAQLTSTNIPLSSSQSSKSTAIMVVAAGVVGCGLTVVAAFLTSRRESKSNGMEKTKPLHWVD
jgi:hypothetical protein